MKRMGEPLMSTSNVSGSIDPLSYHIVPTGMVLYETLMVEQRSKLYLE